VSARIWNSWLRSPPIGPGRRLHRHRGQAEAGEGAQIGDEHRLVAGAKPLFIQVEAVGVLHQELAAAHDPEAGTDLVAELPLDVVEDPRQVAVAPGAVAEDGGDHLLVGRAVEHVPVVPVADPEHLRAVGVVAARLAPQIGRLEGRHQHFDGAGAVLLLADDPLDALEHLEAERKPGVDSGGGLADQAGAEHQLVADDLGVRRGLLHDGEEVTGKAHGCASRGRPASRQPAGPTWPVAVPTQAAGKVPQAPG
jgi:hypothetical protein